MRSKTPSGKALGTPARSGIRSQTKVTDAGRWGLLARHRTDTARDAHGTRAWQHECWPYFLRSQLDI
jgi:hypothetical protein